MTKKKYLKKLLSYDALNEAEKMTGGSVNDEASLAHGIGMANFFENNAKRQKTLSALDDTTFHCSMENYLRIAKEIGFEHVLEIPFVSKAYGDEKLVNERFIVLWRNGLLLTCDTYDGQSRNTSELHFNVKPRKDEDYSTIPGGGTGFEHDGDWVRIGTMDVREGLRFHIEEIEELGIILEKWVQRPYLHLLHHKDWDKHDWRTAKDVVAHHAAIDALVEERIGMLPKHVQDAIGPRKD